VRDLVRAFIEPTFQFKETTPGSEDFIALVARSVADPDDTVRKVFLRLVSKLFKLIFEIFREALPELPEKVLLWRLHFMFGSFAHTMHVCGGMFQTELIRVPTDIDADTIIEMFIAFVTAGMEAE
jgi:hypothetical protein